MPLVDPVTMSPPAGNAKTKDLGLPTQAIPTIPTPLAQGVRHVHPILLLSFFLVRFNALVSDPVSTMWTSLPVVVAIQSTYAIVCLPAAGSQTAKPAKKLRPGEKKSASSDGTVPNVAVTTVVALVLTTLATSVLHTFFVLFGAPLLTHLPHTSLCSLYLSLLGLFPLFYTHGVSNKEWLEILGARAPFDEAFGGLMGGCVGAWVGAVPIPLDWDREWQKWPVTILCGVFGGYVLGKLVGGTVAFGRRFG
ncbi:GPI biosynthesis protein family Pig-F [Pseudomassariella vexata]|uniref:GPI biosynthesis protein family Pig-F n=1 Tax=Pseudomassariella vexata TaxID=1141098 RepID=A0A1Y2DUT9_9PEZI|nr:GPI biosynthesis protein family Pig-F [Pseudomassariella vexata]ORY63033.1 GPI biosynthesis protein family Pig-F [Pseudomassariella vexata]